MVVHSRRLRKSCHNAAHRVLFLRVVHLPYSYFPDPPGGTEVYVQGLAWGLQALGVENLIVAPAREPAAYQHEGLAVRRLATSANPLDLRNLYGQGDPEVADQFAGLLAEVEPDVVHLHAFTSAVSLRLVASVKARGVPVLFTYHTPTVGCQRGTLLRWGTEVCDGEMAMHRCSRCTLHSLGMSRIGSWVVGSLPAAAGWLVARGGCRGRMWTALRMSELVGLHHQAVRALWREVDGIVALCAWVMELLQRNGVPAKKIALCRHGLALKQRARTQPLAKPIWGRSLRLAFLGRLHPFKGIDLVIRALRALPGAAIELDLYGIVQGERDVLYLRHLMDLAGSDERIQIREPVPGGRVLSMLEGYDMLVVPSQSLETGPLVVLEAFAAGIPVLGSHLGGIAEWVVDGVNGLLVWPADSVGAWIAALGRLSEEPALVSQLVAGVASPPTMDEVAGEMLTLYTELGLQNRHAMI